MITITHDTEIRLDAADGGAGDGVARFEVRTDGAGMELLQSRRRGDGSWLLQGRAARAGILTYQRGGQTVRELVEPEVLSDPESMAELERCVVTLEHPEPIPTMITPTNVGRFQVGDVGGDSEAPAVTWDPESGYLIVSVCVRRADAIRAIEQGKHELSIGYRVPQLDMTPGVHPVYGPYDVRQLKRRNNHVAITDSARAGHGASLRVDSAGHLTSGNSMDPTLVALLALLGWRTDNAEAMLAEAPAKIAEMKAGGANVAELEARVSALTSQLAEATSALQAAKAASSTDAITNEIGAACDGMPPADPATMTEMDKRADSIRRVVRERGAERARLEGLASELRVDSAEVAKLGDADLRKRLVLTAYPSAPQDRDPSYYSARLDSYVEGRADRADNPYAEISRTASTNLAARGAERTDAAKAPARKPTISQQSLAQLRPASTEAGA